MSSCFENEHCLNVFICRRSLHSGYGRRIVSRVIYTLS